MMDGLQAHIERFLIDTYVFEPCIEEIQIITSEKTETYERYIVRVRAFFPRKQQPVYVFYYIPDASPPVIDFDRVFNENNDIAEIIREDGAVYEIVKKDDGYEVIIDLDVVKYT